MMAAPTDLINIGTFASDQPLQEEPLLLSLDTYWKSMQSITHASELVRAQPTISSNYPSSATLLRDQLLAVAHSQDWSFALFSSYLQVLQDSQDWSFKIFSSCLEVLQDFVSTSNLMKSALPIVLKSVRGKNPAHSTQGLKIILTKLKQQQANETNLFTSLNNGFGRVAANDATSFQVASISMVMEYQFDEGDNGELAQMKAQLNDLRASMERNKEEIIYLQNSLAKMTKELTHQSQTCSLLMTILDQNPTDEEWKEVEEKIQKTLDLWRRVGDACSSFIDVVVGEVKV